MDHPIEEQNKIQKAFLKKLPSKDRPFHRKLFSIGNASLRYHLLSKKYEPTQDDFDAWLFELPEPIKLSMEERGFESCKTSQRFTKFVLERRNIHEITDYGWLHEQDNRKIVRNDDGKDVELAQEKAMSDMRKSKEEAAAIIEQANKRANQIVDEAKEKAREEANRLLTAAKAEIDQEANRARETLRADVAALVVAGAEKILEASVDANAHAQLVEKLAAEL
ncbi:F0F1 ATP synthase subunit B [uncultured Amphritea sp.]|uniref:F0F1 ATP synthase subunit B n=1 Tax=uncultured Amphritea sp. TaxID=981605 RepID=UPI0034219FFB